MKPPNEADLGEVAAPQDWPTWHATGEILRDITPCGVTRYALRSTAEPTPRHSTQNEYQDALDEVRLG